MIYAANIFLRAVESADMNETYLDWLNDPNVNQFLETRFHTQDLDSIRSYWQNHHNDPSSPWFAICLLADGRHIGNIKLGPIDWVKRQACLSLFIGDKTCWGHGLATESIAAVRDWAFSELDLLKLKAGISSENIGSRRAFEKCGFQFDGHLRSNHIIGGDRRDSLLMALPRSLWEAQL